MVHHGDGRLVRVALPDEARQEREADVDILQHVPLEQPADSNRRTVGLQGRQVQSEAEPLVTRQRSLLQIRSGILRRPDAAVPDEADERRVVQKLDDKLRIIQREPADDQAFGFNGIHAGMTSFALTVV